MKTKQILPWLMMFFIGMVSSPVLAQSYDQLWKEVETYQKKDLPKSVMATAGKNGYGGKDLRESKERTQLASDDESATGALFFAGVAYSG